MPTPGVAMLTRSLRADLGVMLSASHNPFYDNGIKLFGPDCYKLSDEIEVCIENLINNRPSSPRGGFHFINFNDPDNQKEDAVYIVPEAGSHNQWVYGDILLAAFYQAGIRILDISGELLGDLYKQGREIG